MNPARPLILSATVLLAGCTVGPDYSKPRESAPNAFRSIDSADTSAAAPEVPAQSTRDLKPGELARWWTLFEDKTLDSLVQRAVESNLDLRLAAQRIVEARALRGVAASEFYPSVDAKGGFTQNRLSLSSTNFPLPNRDRSVWQAGVDASWEIDVFGRIRRGVEAADADLQSLAENQRDVLVIVVSEVARNYADARAFQARIAVAENAIRAQNDTVGLTNSRFKAGLTSEVDVAQAQAQLARREALLPDLRSGYRQAVHRLGVLLGREPAAVLSELAEPGTIPAIKAPVQTGLPAELLARRPDVRRAERQLAAATARIGVATADLYPRFSLLGSLGVSALDFSDLFKEESVYWTIGPSIQWKLLNGWRVRNNIKAADARAAQAMTVYEQSILTALEDVENSIVAFSQEQARRRALSVAAESNQRAVQLATDRYKSGVGDFLTVLDAQRQLYDAQDQLAESQGAVSIDLIRLYKSLGGGWDDTPPPEPSKEANAKQ